MIRFIAHALIVLACWTLVIKFAFPLVYDFRYNHPAGTHIFWDFWWVVHLWLAWALLDRAERVWLIAVAISVAEITIVSVKFFYFLRNPLWDIWYTNWFINKLFVLAIFAALLFTLLTGRYSQHVQSIRLALDESQHNESDDRSG